MHRRPFREPKGQRRSSDFGCGPTGANDYPLAPTESDEPPKSPPRRRRAFAPLGITDIIVGEPKKVLTSSSSIRIASNICRRNSWASCCRKSRYCSYLRPMVVRISLRTASAGSSWNVAESLTEARIQA